MVIAITNKDNNFYNYTLAFFRRKNLINNGPVYDDDNKTWYLKLDNDKVIGFAAVIENSICSCFVLPEYRRKGVMTEIIKKIISTNKTKLDAVCNEMILPIFIKLGFVLKKKTIRGFFIVELEL